jgi:hypothetical protein
MNRNKSYSEGKHVNWNSEAMCICLKKTGEKGQFLKEMTKKINYYEGKHDNWNSYAMCICLKKTGAYVPETERSAKFLLQEVALTNRAPNRIYVLRAPPPF